MGLLRCLRRIFGRGAAAPTRLGVPDPAGEDVALPGSEWNSGPGARGPGVSESDIMEPDVVDLGAADTLDLHTFRPQDVASVVIEFLDEAVRKGIPQVRIIHGKGIGVQREIVRGILEKRPDVVTFGDATDSSGWGATVVRLRSGAADTNGG